MCVYISGEDWVWYVCDVLYTVLYGCVSCFVVHENCLHPLPISAPNSSLSKSDKDLIVTGNHDSLADIDPDIGIHLIQNNQCIYYNITEFNSAMTDKTHISILAVNIQSFYKNFKQFQHYVNSLEVKWSFIKISETWGNLILLYITQ